MRQKNWALFLIEMIFDVSENSDFGCCGERDLTYDRLALMRTMV